MMSKTMQDALNEQMKHEFYSSYLYLSMSAYLDAANLPAAWEMVTCGGAENNAEYGKESSRNFELLLRKRHEIALGKLFDDIARGERGVGRPCSRLAYISEGRKPAAVDRL